MNDSLDLSDFFSAVSTGKQKRKQQLDSTVGEAVDDFFNTISLGKREQKEKKESLVADSFENLFWTTLTEDVSISNKQKKKKLKKENLLNRESSPLNGYSDDFISDNQEISNTNYSSLSSVHESNNIIERSLGLLSEPSDIKHQSDPLTPLDQKFSTFNDLEKHYKLFLSRIQQQLSTIGGGGETNLTYMDVPVTSVTSPSYSVKHQDYYIGVNYAGAVSITLPKADREGKIFVIKDELGEASKGTNRYITILPTGFDLIDGRDRAILAYDYGSLTFIWKGNSWRVI